MNRHEEGAIFIQGKSDPAIFFLEEGTISKVAERPTRQSWRKEARTLLRLRNEQL